MKVDKSKLPDSALIDTRVFIRYLGEREDDSAEACKAFCDAMLEHERTLYVAAPTLAEVIRQNGKPVPRTKGIVVVPFDERCATVLGTSMPMAKVSEAKTAAGLAFPTSAGPAGAGGVAPPAPTEADGEADVATPSNAAASAPAEADARPKPNESEERCAADKLGASKQLSSRGGESSASSAPTAPARQSLNGVAGATARPASPDGPSRPARTSVFS